MACGGCSKKRDSRNDIKRQGLSEERILLNKVFGNYKYLTDRQIKARLDIYKKRNCKACDRQGECDIGSFFKCKGIK